MSVFLSNKFKNLIPYTPGEQPRDMKYLKLNTNESPFPPSEKAVKRASEEALRMRLYSDPNCTDLVKKLAEVYGVNPENVICTNGSDEILNFAFAAYCDNNHPAAFPDITYGFYPVFADFNGVPYVEIPLKDDLSIDVNDYTGINKTVFIANPNAPTGIALSVSQLERIIESNRNNIVVIDEAYVDFGAESCIPLIKQYDNLLVTQTFSKSRSMAGARLGFGVASESIIKDLNAIRYSTNPYNVNMITMAAGIGALCDEEYTRNNCRHIAENREYTVKELLKLGFTVAPSSANFVFAKHDRIDGETLYKKMKEKGVLIRHFTKERIKDYNRITIGTLNDMLKFTETLKTVMEELL